MSAAYPALRCLAVVRAGFLAASRPPPISGSMNDDYGLDFFIDFKANLWCKGSILAHEGRLLEAILKVE